MKRYTLSLAAGLLILGTAAMARPQFVGVARSTYNLSGPAMASVAKCASCHNPNKSMNPFGASLKATMAKMKLKQLTPAVLKAVETQDADKDGVPNGTELKAGTNPGDPKSK